MCNSSPNPNWNNNDSNNQNQQSQGMYPDISRFFETGDQGDANATNEANEPSFREVLLRILQEAGRSMEQMNQIPQGDTNTNAPSSENQNPPSAPTMDEDQHRQTNQHQQQHHHEQQQSFERCRCRTPHQWQNIDPMFFNKCAQFCTTFTDTLKTVFTMVFLIFVLTMLPQFIMSQVVFLIVASGLGLSIPTMIACNMILMVTRASHPLLLAAFSIWAFHRAVIQKKRLFNSWGRFRRSSGGGCFKFKMN